MPALYLLSPPFVAWMIGGEAFERVNWVYRPILWLELNSDTYNSYLELFPEEIGD